MVKSTRLDLVISAVLALVMLATRTHSISQYVHLPDTSWASFFIAGFYIRNRLAFPALFLLAFAIDLVVIGVKGGSSFCFTPAYWMLVPAYGVMWFAGQFSAKRFGPDPKALLYILLTICAASIIAHLCSSGGFYMLSGHFTDQNISEFASRAQRYFPGSLLATLTWCGVAAATHIALNVIVPSSAGARIK
ncbi:MAG: hypothetical protein V7676_13145 [Parasphingorhabdus sp.]|uniref:hypothetical protein n=1 Tax=Parasphingorhabdus sp. TaxID=2709688 RepID=UPI003001BB2E